MIFFMHFSGDYPANYLLNIFSTISWNTSSDTHNYRPQPQYTSSKSLSPNSLSLIKTSSSNTIDFCHSNYHGFEWLICLGRCVDWVRSSATSSWLMIYAKCIYYSSIINFTIFMLIINNLKRVLYRKLLKLLLLNK